MAYADIADRPSFNGRWVGLNRRLALVLALPFLDGVFVMLVIAGVLNSAIGILVTGVVVVGGSAAAAIVLTDRRQDANRQLVGLGVLGAVLIPLAGVQAALAPSIATLVDLVVLERAAALVLLLIAVEVASSRAPRWLPRPSVIVLVGVLVSLHPTAPLEVGFDTDLFVRGTLTASVGIGTIGLLILAGRPICRRIHSSVLGYGGGASLGVLAIAMVTAVPEVLALAVLLIALIASYVVDRIARVDATGVRLH